MVDMDVIYVKMRADHLLPLIHYFIVGPTTLQRFAENLQIKKGKNNTAHAQYWKDQRKNGKGLLFAFLEVARTLQTALTVARR